MARECLKRLGVDAVWFLVSPGNPQKPQGGMAAFDARAKSLGALVAGRPSMVVSDIEARLGTRYSADTVGALKKAMPRTRFIWIMGADCLAGFHTWYRWREIAKMLPIAVFDRPAYANHGLNSKFARCFAKFRTTPQRLSRSAPPAWAFVQMPRHPGSATKLRQQMGRNWPAGVNSKET